MTLFLLLLLLFSSSYSFYSPPFLMIITNIINLDTVQLKEDKSTINMEKRHGGITRVTKTTKDGGGRGRGRGRRMEKRKRERKKERGRLGRWRRRNGGGERS